MSVAVAVGAASCCACGAVGWLGCASRESSSATQPVVHDRPAGQASEIAEDAGVDFTALNAALGPRPPDEQVLFQALQPGDCGELASSWTWVQQEPGWRVDKQGKLILRCAKTGGSGAGTKNLLLCDFPLTEHGWGRAAVTTVVHSGGKELGEQAGLVWYHDDSNYLKLVLQVGHGGVVGVVFAVVINGDVTFVAEKECPASGLEPTNLRIEVDPSGCSVAATLSLDYCEQLVGVCADVSALGLTGNEVRVGVIANGASDKDGQPPTQAATFSNFNLLGLAPDRVSFASDTTASPSILQPLDGLTAYGQPNEAAGIEMNADQALQGWTLSEDLSSTERDEIAGMLASVGPPPDGQTVPSLTVVHNPQ
eukprot:COSAG02_NODE_1206_length_13888_cov_15.018130_4_plen_367_part_00